MQISEFRDLLANDGFAATFQTMGQYRTELLRALDALRAQADARPVAWMDPLDLQEGREQFMACSAQHERLNSNLRFKVPLYTHPEASAPGLSDDVRAVLKEAHACIGNLPDGHSDHLRQAACKEAIARILTRASAATVAEPSDTLPERDQSKPAEQQGLFRKFIVQRVDGSDAPGGKHHGCEYFVLDMTHDQHAAAALRAYAEACAVTHPQLSADLRARHGAAQQQAEPNDGDEIACSSCGLTMDQSRALAAQQAEPGADERAAFVAWWATLSPQMYARMTPAQFAEAGFVAGHHAAQSGQRAGVPIEAVAKAYGYLWHVNEMNADLAHIYPPAKAAYAARKVLREFLTHEQRGKAINEAGREIGRYVDESDRAVAPTQQQEGGS